MLQNNFINPFYSGLFQIGFVTRDLDKSVDHFTKTLGTGKFMKMINPAVREQTWNGKAIDIKVNLAFGQWGKMNIEIIQPIEGESSYTEILRGYEWMGIHHLGIKVYQMDKAIADMKSNGIALIQSGTFGDHTVFHYFDTRSLYGHYTELLYFDENTEVLFDSITRGDF